MQCSIRRIVVVRPDDKLGETLLATPVFQALKESLPEASVEAWVNKRWSAVIEGSPWLDGVRGVPYRPRGGAFWRLVLSLRRYRPDAMLILRPDTRRYALIARWAGVPVRTGAILQRRSVAKLLTHVASYKACMHQVERNLAVAEAMLGGELPRCPLHFAPAQPATLPSELRSLPHKGYAVLHLSTGGVQPRWLPDRFAAVATFLAQNYRLTPVLSSAPDDLPFGAQCKQAIREPVIDLAGRLTILELAEVLRGACLLVSVDTGVVHLAAAVGTPCVSLHFRRDYPPHQWHAWGVPYATVVPAEYCAGCTPLRCQPHPRQCVASLPVEPVIEAVENLLTTS